MSNIMYFKNPKSLCGFVTFIFDGTLIDNFNVNLREHHFILLQSNYHLISVTPVLS